LWTMSLAKRVFNTHDVSAVGSTPVIMWVVFIIVTHLYKFCQSHWPWWRQSPKHLTVTPYSGVQSWSVEKISLHSVAMKEASNLINTNSNGIFLALKHVLLIYQ
jgi:hypothetical protein